jgi:vacuolar-type H+-ATPase subunit E/Vma4
MTLNPITALSEQLQKLINEHGSADILRDHLALFKDQVMLMEKKYIDLEMKLVLSENEKSVLRSKIQELETKIQQFAKDNDELRGKVQNYEQSNHNLSFHEIEQKITLYLKNNPKSSIKQISASTGVNIPKVRELLELYRCSGGASSTLESPDGDSLWSLQIYP